MGLYEQAGFKNARVRPCSDFFGVVPASRLDKCNALRGYIETSSLHLKQSLFEIEEKPVSYGSVVVLVSRYTVPEE